MSEQNSSTGLAALSATSTLLQATQAFKLYLTNEAYSLNTIKSFGHDLKLFGSYIGYDRPIGRISTENINAFLHWLRHERGVPCSPKSYARRVTTVKVFFRWLHKNGVLPQDPGAPVIQHSVEPPLPQILNEQEIQKALQVTQAMWAAARPDPRPHLLLKLLLETAIKKSECMAIKLQHIRRETPEGPMLEIRYDDPRKQTKERRLPLSQEIISVLDDYIQAYSPTDTLFTCTARNLEYVLTDVAEQAGIKKGISFEMLRWTAIVRDYVKGVEETRLRQKLGISPITWQFTGPKIKTLAENYQ